MPAATAPSVSPFDTSVPPRSWWWGFALYAAISIVHVTTIAVNATAVITPTKLLLMPTLVVAVVWACRGIRWRTPHVLLASAIALSWLGDGAGALFPFLPELPMMLLFFGLAHIVYIVLFQRHLAVRRMPAWALVYAAWWVALVVTLWPYLGALTVPVMIYGLVLGGTAASSTRCPALVVWGGALFLASDTVLAFRIFLPEAMPDWTSPLVMITYCAGQGLIAVGAVRMLQRRRR